MLLCIIFSDTKGIQWVDTDATHANTWNLIDLICIGNLTKLDYF